jgi:hypothetical protein
MIINPAITELTTAATGALLAWELFKRRFQAKRKPPFGGCSPRFILIIQRVISGVP